MRSTSVTPPPRRPATVLPKPMKHAKDDDDDEIILISERGSTVKGKAPRSLAKPSGINERRRASTSPYKHQSTLKTEAREAEAESAKKPDKKRAYDKDDDYTDERLVSEELVLHEMDVEEEVEEEERTKKDVRRSGAHKKVRKAFTPYEDKLIIEQILATFDPLPFKAQTDRAYAPIKYRYLKGGVILKAALRGLHGEEHAVLPGEASTSTSAAARS